MWYKSGSESRLVYEQLYTKVGCAFSLSFMAPRDPVLHLDRILDLYRDY